jgi:hypothetical protein
MLLRSMQENPNWVSAYRFLASRYAQMGRLAEAREIIERLRTLTDVVVPHATHWRNPEHRELYLNGLSPAGTGQLLLTLSGNAANTSPRRRYFLTAGHKMLID